MIRVASHVEVAMFVRLDRREVAERLGTSTTSERRMEGVLLHPQLDADGVWRFDSREVDEVAAQRPPRKLRRTKVGRASGDGAAAARVFRMLSHGRTLREIVVATGQSPAFVRQMYAEWMVALEAVLYPTRSLVGTAD
jgi:hypothetical protein